MTMSPMVTTYLTDEFTSYEKVLYVRNKIVKEFGRTLQSTVFMEFGVGAGKSFNMFYELYKRHDIRDCVFLGFDSWSGLGEESEDNNNPTDWVKGMYNEQPSQEFVSKFCMLNYVRMFNGWFHETLTPSLYDLMTTSRKYVGLIHMDCYQYTPTYHCLGWLYRNGFIRPGVVIVYNNWGGYKVSSNRQATEYEVGQGKAHAEFTARYQVRTEYVANYKINNHDYEIAVFFILL